MAEQLNNSLTQNQIWGRNNKRKSRPSCLLCGKEVSKKYNKFCSVSCAQKTRFSDKKNHPNWQGLTAECRECGKEKNIKPYKLKLHKNFFCSRPCLQKFQVKENAPMWKGGNSDLKSRLRRRERMIKNGGKHSEKEWSELKEKHNYTCLLCGKKEPEIKLTKDHVIPVSKGGDNNITNIQPLCLRCNTKKFNHTASSTT